VDALVSVVMPVLNAGPWLGEAIASILAQSRGALELVVVDDGSADDSRDVAARAAKQDSRVRTLFLERDPASTSSARAANAGIATARGRYIARMDADDIALPGRLDRQVAFLEDRALDACGGLAQAFGTEEKLYWYPESHEGVVRELIFRVGILHPTLLARAELMRAHAYDPKVSHEDHDWQVRVAAAGARLGNVQEVVLRHRNHPDQANRRHRELFVRDLRQQRFRHVMRLFPGTGPAQYQALAWLAEGAPFESPEELEAAGRWLVRLADLPDPRLRRAMDRRWGKACERAGLPKDDPLRRRIRAEIESG
jgi:glycosyltransferase involved in cell wall biosynthesis